MNTNLHVIIANTVKYAILNGSYPRYILLFIVAFCAKWLNNVRIAKISTPAHHH
jgi:hypothetical protein